MVLTRASTWEQSLADYITAKRGEPFAWGSNDCCCFISGAVEAMTGVDPMAEYRGTYDSEAGALAILERDGGLEAIMDSKFPVVAVGMARRGDIAFHDGSVGIVAGNFAWFASDDGLTRVSRSEWAKAWANG
jgi:hypothetical protein